jgi:hypothetical protein
MILKKKNLPKIAKKYIKEYYLINKEKATSFFIKDYNLYQLTKNIRKS